MATKIVKMKKIEGEIFRIKKFKVGIKEMELKKLKIIEMKKIKGKIFKRKKIVFYN